MPTRADADADWPGSFGPEGKWRRRLETQEPVAHPEETQETCNSKLIKIILRGGGLGKIVLIFPGGGGSWENVDNTRVLASTAARHRTEIRISARKVNLQTISVFAFSKHSSVALLARGYYPRALRGTW